MKKKSQQSLFKHEEAYTFQDNPVSNKGEVSGRATKIHPLEIPINRWNLYCGWPAIAREFDVGSN